MFSNPTAPNLPDYTIFLYNHVEINPLYLPANSPFIQYALNRSIALTLNIPSACIPGIEYTIAVYNGATHIQLAITPDVGADGAFYTFFRDKRKDYDLLKPAVGLELATSDQGTSFTYAVPDSLKQLTLTDLDFYKTSWGRNWLAFQQDFGVVWGLS
jgi:hypothetical protein